MIDIKDFENYAITKEGNVYSKRYNRFLKATKNGEGYYTVKLINNKEYKTHYIHRLVAEYFITRIENKNYVNHKDGIRSNNSIENLEWVDNIENIKHGYKRRGFIKNRYNFITIDKIKELKIEADSENKDFYELLLEYFIPS